MLELLLFYQRHGFPIGQELRSKKFPNSLIVVVKLVAFPGSCLSWLSQRH